MLRERLSLGKASAKISKPTGKPTSKGQLDVLVVKQMRKLVARDEICSHIVQLSTGCGVVFLSRRYLTAYFTKW